LVVIDNVTYLCRTQFEQWANERPQLMVAEISDTLPLCQVVSIHHRCFAAVGCVSAVQHTPFALVLKSPNASINIPVTQKALQGFTSKKRYK